LTSEEAEDADFIFRVWADFELFIVSLARLRRAAILAAKVPEIKANITAGPAEFDAALPMVKTMRDVAEHFDDDGVDKGRCRSVSRKNLEVGAFNDTTLQWLGHELDADVAFLASERLFTCMRSTRKAHLTPRG
jgi:hypothetical protein